jgi:hypothetical protein
MDMDPSNARAREERHVREEGGEVDGKSNPPRSSEGGRGTERQQAFVTPLLSSSLKRG